MLFARNSTSSDPLVTGSAIGLISSIDDKTNTSVFSSAVSTAADLNGVPTILSNIDTDTLKLKTDAKVAFFDEDFEKAVWIFTHALANGPATAELYACRAKVHNKMKNYRGMHLLPILVLFQQIS